LEREDDDMPRGFAALLMLSILLTACAGPGAGVTGNDTGGIIPWANVSPVEARDIARSHCAAYNKVACATGVDARYGGYYSFSCTFNGRRR
jgi:hypothetical protein